MADLRIIFMGTPEFAVPSLEELIRRNYRVVAVVTAPDKPRGRGRKITPSPVKEIALKHEIPVLQPTHLNTIEFVNHLKSFRPDLQVVVAFRLLPHAVWSLPPLGSFNLHASLLPKYRGAAPIAWAIINGETETGLTTFMLRKGVDTGPILWQEKEPIYAHDTAGTLAQRLMTKGAQLVGQTIESLSQAEPTLNKQPEQTQGLPIAPKLTKEMAQIRWDQPSASIINWVRGLNPSPGAYTQLRGKTFKIFTCRFPHSHEGNDDETSFIQTDGKTYLTVKSADGRVAIEEWQPEGKKRMSISAYFRGHTW